VNMGRLTKVFGKTRIAGVVVVAMTLGGCVSQETVPQDYFYRLPDLHPSAPRQAKLFNGVLQVDELHAEGVYRERPLLYVDAKRPLEVLQYHYRHWIQVPSQLIQENLIEYLRQANVAARVERYSSDSQRDMLIGGRLQKFEQLVKPAGATAVVAMEIDFRRNTSQGTLKQTKIYEHKVMAQGPTIHDSVIAFGKALQLIYDDILADLGTLAGK
jgi:ABC-type uncharacterized transport system auxiliary subunit